MVRKSVIAALVRSEKGATAVEYGLIVSLIFLAMVAGLSNLANKTNAVWNNVSTAVSNN